MYNPEPFKVKNVEKLVKYARKYNFGTVFSSLDGTLSVSSVPMLIDDKFSKISGHFALANNIWRGLDGKIVMVQFNGPNHYISPDWYEEEHAVPTWNYVSITVSGELRIIDDLERLKRILDDLTAFGEKQIGGDWAADWSDPTLIDMTNSIVAFEILVKEVQGKWKLSQNHPREKCMNVSRHLRALGNSESSEMANLMDSPWL